MKVLVTLVMISGLAVAQNAKKAAIQRFAR